MPAESGSIVKVISSLPFNEVTRWVRVLGAPAAYREDLAQDVFVIVHRRLPGFDGQNVGGWLYQIARHRVRDFRRGLWFRHQLVSAGLDPNACRELRASPSETLESKRGWSTLDQLLFQLKEHERVALVLFEIEGLSGEEIAAIQGVSIHAVFPVCAGDEPSSNPRSASARLALRFSRTVER